MKVLYAEDSELVRRSISRYMRRTGLEVVEARDGQAAWEAFEANPGSFSVVITDARMPRLSGAGLIARIRNAGHDVPLVVLSGEPGEEPTDDATVIMKPVLPQNLVDLLLELRDAHGPSRPG